MISLIYRLPIAFLLLSSTLLNAGEPDGYYDSTEGLTDTALQLALHDIIDNHTVVSYSSLWIHFQTTDKKTNGNVWDMYSDNPGGTAPYEYTFVSDQCGNYSGEGSCYNREHSWPKSWFNDDSPMNTDLFHLYPTDGYVNGRRSNYPFGEVGSASWTSQNGSKVGSSSYPGYSGTVFEPIDEYKGDFARTYFYMAVRYLGEDGGWPGSPMVNGSQLEEWALEMLMDWHYADSVSQKETDRNDAVYEIQGNRNPFIDRPYFVDNLWGEPVSVQGSPISTEFELTPAFPNPFNPATSFRVKVGKRDNYSISIIDISGSIVYSIYNDDLTAGTHSFQWNGRTSGGNTAASGIYFISVKNSSQFTAGKLALVR